MGIPLSISVLLLVTGIVFCPSSPLPSNAWREESERRLTLKIILGVVMSAECDTGFRSME